MCIYLGTMVIYALVLAAMSVLDFFKCEPGGVWMRVLGNIPWPDLQGLMILALETPVPNDRDLE
ncbi:hypothetical protein ColLi_07262 [Colletotrichum liriopes]|uniref:Uncharacterized protein n=1 Tax=Colletotrichum liriopes TaxID=708192 RepID=A0AA37GPE8_9PEZI|nr:hypothetical protein ColLi_07262 [Colletotrichum liriopes]